MDTLTLLGPEQLAEVATIPGQLKDTGDVNAILNNVPSKELASFFDEFSPAVEVYCHFKLAPLMNFTLKKKTHNT